MGLCHALLGNSHGHRLRLGLRFHLSSILKGMMLRSQGSVLTLRRDRTILILSVWEHDTF